ncbi:MAG: hypothetical protein KDD92_09110 [Caldilineaceae bacterium]|nr:hypothetical protein [Caldilineaceae bacterium]
MWKQILGDMDDFDLNKIGEMVDVFWEKRDQLMETMDYFSTYKDRITAVVEYISENKERLGELMDSLPEIMDKTGVGIETAGLSAERASALLTGDNKDDKIISAYEMTGMAAVALQRCTVQLENIATLIQELGDKVDGIRIPSFDAQFTEVMGFRVITGLDINENSLTGDIGDRFHGGADRISEISDDFTRVSEQFRKLGTMLVHTGDNLNSVGSQLQRSGKSLRAMTPDTAKRSVTIDVTAVERPIKEAGALDKEIAKLEAEAAKLRKARERAAKKKSG